MKSKLNYLLLLSVSLGILGCKKDSVEENSIFSGSAAKTAGIVSKAVPNNGDTYTVDVFYFLPKGTTVVADYQSRINNLTSFTKTWFTNQLATRNNLLANNLLDFTATNGNVTVTIIQGKNAATGYNGPGGLAAADAEINAYIAANPTVKHSEHSLVYFPGTAPLTPVTGLNVGTCRTQGKKRIYDVDYPGYDSNLQDKNFNIAYGTFLHELGHSFNLDHNRAPKTLAAAKGGQNFMSNKAITFSNTLYISAADVEILKTCQVFNKKSTIAYYNTTANLDVTDFNSSSVAGTDKNKIDLNFKSNVAVKAIVFYNDAASTGSREFSEVSDYDAFSGVVTLTQPQLEGAVNYELSSNDFYDLTAGKKYRLRIGFVLENGTVVKKDYFYFTDGKGPSFNDLGALDKTGWKIISVSSEKPNGLAKLLFDGNTETTWLSNGSMNNSVEVDCGKTIEASYALLSQPLGNTSMPPYGCRFEVWLKREGDKGYFVKLYFRTATLNTTTDWPLMPRVERFGFFSNDNSFGRKQTFRYFKIVTSYGLKSFADGTRSVPYVSEFGFAN